MFNGRQEPPQLKIEIPANRSEKFYASWSGVHLLTKARYDMLCFEGISLMLNIFRGKQTSPNYRLVPPPSGELEVLTCHESVCFSKL